MDANTVAALLGSALLVGLLAAPIVPIEEEYTVTEPYETTEAYTEMEPVTVYDDLDYSVLDYQYDNHFWTDRADVSVELRNDDSEPGEFWINFDIATTTGTTSTSTDEVFLTPGETHEFGVTVAGSYQDSSYEVHTSGKEVTQYREVEKERVVTKTREVTETKEERKSVLELSEPKITGMITGSN